MHKFVCYFYTFLWNKVFTLTNNFLFKRFSIFMTFHGCDFNKLMYIHVLFSLLHNFAKLRKRHAHLYPIFPHDYHLLKRLKNTFKYLFFCGHERDLCRTRGVWMTYCFVNMYHRLMYFWCDLNLNHQWWTKNIYWYLNS